MGTPSKTTPKLLVELLALHLGGLALVGILACLGGTPSYLGEVATHTISLGAILWYCVYLIAYASLVEASLRLLQEALCRRGWSLLSLTLPALAYGALHLHYSVTGFFYATLLGAFVAWRASLVRRWWWFVLWHIQWDLMAFAATIVLVLASPGEPRTLFSYHYKASRIEAGALQYRPGWGWFDLKHASPRHFQQVERAIFTQASSLTLETDFSDSLGQRHSVERQYKVHPHPTDPRLRWGISAGIALDLAQQSEAAQEQGPIWWGARMSAWQFDDLPSALRACLDLYPAAPTPPAMITEKAALLARWNLEGHTLVQTEHRALTLPDSASDQERAALYWIQAARAYWSPQ